MIHRLSRTERAARAPRASRGGWAMLAAIAAGALALGMATSHARADEAAREGKLELFVLGQYSSEDDADFGGFSLAYEDTFAGGLGVGVNFYDTFNINLTVMAGESTISGFGFDDSSTFITPEVNVDWNVLKYDLTPFVTAGGGAMIFTSGEEDETELTYGVGGGIRWDFAEDAFLKVWYRAKWFDVEVFNDDAMLHTINIGIGWMR